MKQTKKKEKKATTLYYIKFITSNGEQVLDLGNGVNFKNHIDVTIKDGRIIVMKNIVVR